MSGGVKVFFAALAICGAGLVSNGAATAADDECEPGASSGGSYVAPTVGGGDFRDASGLSDQASGMPGWVFRNVARGSQWMGDAYGSNFPAGSSDPEPQPPTPDPAPTANAASDSDDPPYAVDGRIAGPVGDYTARAAWWLGTQAGSTPPPQLGPGPGGDDSSAAPSPAPCSDSGCGGGIWTQPLVKEAAPRFR